MDPHGDSNLSLIGLGKVDLPGQTGDRSYEERQRNPGDWNAQVSQGPIAVHGNEYLGTTDRGIILLRRRLRANIRALAQGLKPAPEFGASATPTYIHEIVLRVPPRPGSDDGELRRSFGRAVARIVIDSGTLQTDKRGAEVERRVRALAFETSLS
jgi:hypothetical protein